MPEPNRSSSGGNTSPTLQVSVTIPRFVINEANKCAGTMEDNELRSSTVWSLTLHDQFIQKYIYN